MISLEAATRTCKVDTASAARIESDRFLNPSLAMCPRWTGKDLTGRTVCADSFYTKRAGCNSAEDRVMVENGLRPQYSEYINLDVGEGIRGNLYRNNMYYQNAGTNTRQMKFAETKTGHFGGVFSTGTNEATCSYNAYEKAQAQEQNSRHQHQHQHQHQHHRRGSHQSQVRENYVQAPNNTARMNAIATNGYRSCKFTSASGF
jgi:hypothetical protein